MLSKIEIINKYLELFPCVTDEEKEIVESYKNNYNINYKKHINKISIIRFYTLIDIFSKNTRYQILIKLIQKDNDDNLIKYIIFIYNYFDKKSLSSSLFLNRISKININNNNFENLIYIYYKCIIENDNSYCGINNCDYLYNNSDSSSNDKYIFSINLFEYMYINNIKLDNTYLNINIYKYIYSYIYFYNQNKNQNKNQEEINKYFKKIINFNNSNKYEIIESYLSVNCNDPYLDDNLKLCYDNLNDKKIISIYLHKVLYSYLRGFMDKNILYKFINNLSEFKVNILEIIYEYDIIKDNLTSSFIEIIYYIMNNNLNNIDNIDNKDNYKFNIYIYMLKKTIYNNNSEKMEILQKIFLLDFNKIELDNYLLIELLNTDNLILILLENKINENTKHNNILKLIYTLKSIYIDGADYDKKYLDDINNSNTIEIYFEYFNKKNILKIWYLIIELYNNNNKIDNIIKLFNKNNIECILNPMKIHNNIIVAIDIIFNYIEQNINNNKIDENLIITICNLQDIIEIYSISKFEFYILLNNTKLYNKNLLNLLITNYDFKINNDSIIKIKIYNNKLKNFSKKDICMICLDQNTTVIPIMCMNHFVCCDCYFHIKKCPVNCI